MFCHGFVGAGLFLGWLGGVVRRAIDLTTPQGMWLASVPLLAVVQLPIYGLLPPVVLLGVGAALGWRACYPEIAAGPPPDHAPGDFRADRSGRKRPQQAACEATSRAPGPRRRPSVPPYT